MFLSEHDPEPVTVVDNNSNIIISGPHNGDAVPECLSPCLGTNEEWFKAAHEAKDLYVDELFEVLNERMQNASFISGNYSRLVCDLNRMPDYAVTLCSSEFNELVIPENQPDQCCQQQKIERLDAIYAPYHDAKTMLINQARQEHGGVIVMDLHSYAPEWQNENREVQVGTLRCEKTPYSNALEEFLREQSEFKFVSGEPYRVAERASNVAPLLSETNDLQYLGLEIRNDLIATPEGRERMADFIIEAIEYLENHPEAALIKSPRSLLEAANEQEYDPYILDGWAI